MDDAQLEAILVQIFEAANVVYEQMVGEYVAAQIEKEMSPGGEAYERIMNGAISGAIAWYGMYSPRVYQREYSMSSRGNIKIQCNVSANDGKVQGTFSVENVSPHAVYSYGFYFHSSEGLQYRPGGDLMANVPSEVTISVVIPQDVVDSMYRQAMSIVMGK